MEEQPNVIVYRSQLFTAGYMERNQEFYDERQEWIKENLGYTADHEESYTMIENKVYIRFIFYTEEDATAFKLRWA